ncbi:MAG: universal stress protein [Acidimicrobiia bacterium]|nr:universal stress protein [Acidimicrobiia bacterium]
MRIGEGSREEVVLPSLAHAQVLVPVLLPDPDPLPGPLARLLPGLDLLVVGIYEVPKQTAAEQARDEFGEEAEEALERWSRDLRHDVGDVETRLVFSQEPLASIERIGAEEHPDAILVPRPVGEESIGQILVPVRSDANAERIARFVAAIADAAHAGVLVVHAAGPDEGGGDRGSVVDGFRRRLVDEGIDDERIETDVVEGDDPASVIIDEAGRHHLVVVGESEPDDPEVVFGDLTRRVAREIERPVLVARAERDGSDEGG